MTYIIGIILIIIGIFLLCTSLRIKQNRIQEIKKNRQDLLMLQQQKTQLQQTVDLISKKIQQQQQQYRTVTQAKNKQQQLYRKIVKTNDTLNNKQLDQLKKKQQTYKQLQKQYEKGYLNYVQTLNKAYDQKEIQFKSSREQLQKSLAQLQAELTATAAAKRKEEEKEKQLDFYKIQITDKQKQDIQLLNSWKSQLSDPSLVSKVIWSSCIMKPTGDLCNRLTNGKTICGIYKITSLKDYKAYIGQSVDIATRFKQHIKCGLGIDAPATNKLYNLMQQEGVYNFTFQIIEECKKEKLNERQRFWIQTYQSDKFGINGTGGNKK